MAKLFYPLIKQANDSSPIKIKKDSVSDKIHITINGDDIVKLAELKDFYLSESTNCMITGGFQRDENNQLKLPLKAIGDVSTYLNTLCINPVATLFQDNNKIYLLGYINRGEVTLGISESNGNVKGFIDYRNDFPEDLVDGNIWIKIDELDNLSGSLSIYGRDEVDLLDYGDVPNYLSFNQSDTEETFPIRFENPNGDVVDVNLKHQSTTFAVTFLVKNKVSITDCILALWIHYVLRDRSSLIRLLGDTGIFNCTLDGVDATFNLNNINITSVVYVAEPNEGDDDYTRLTSDLVPIASGSIGSKLKLINIDLTDPKVNQLDISNEFNIEVDKNGIYITPSSDAISELYIKGLDIIRINTDGVEETEVINTESESTDVNGEEGEE